MKHFQMFLEANGHDFAALQLFVPDTSKPLQEEKILNSVVSDDRGNELIAQERVPWRDIKNQALVTPNGKFRNPWSYRFAYGGKEARSWQSQLREIGENYSA